MRCKFHYYLVVLILLFIFASASFLYGTPCSAQLFYPYGFGPAFLQPFSSGFFPGIYNPFVPLYPTVAPFGFAPSAPFLGPVSASVPTIPFRSGAATIITLPAATTAAPVTAYAPLGTLNLTPSTLVFLILLFTLEG